MDPQQAVYATDEVIDRLSLFAFTHNDIKYGRPFIILREQAKKTRSHGVEAIKVGSIFCSISCLVSYLNSHTFLRHGQLPILSEHRSGLEVRSH